jgi:hypothetical protein
MQIVSALFADDIELRQADGNAARIDLTGIQFSAAAPGPFPVTVTPHLVIIVRCGADEAGTIEAHCRIDMDDPTVVPYTLLPPV